MPRVTGKAAWLLAAVAALAAPIFSGGTVHAFESTEHLYVTNASWAVAFSRLDETERRSFNDMFENELGQFDPLGDPNGMRSLGFITLAVDCYSRPARWADPNFLSRKGIALFSTEYFEELENRCGKFSAGKYLAMQTNETHFQEGATRSYLEHHRQALVLARQGKMPWALVHEMLALHYFEDFMAPGHLVSSRETNQGAISGAVHDLYNYCGLPVEGYWNDSTWKDASFEDPLIARALRQDRSIGVTKEELSRATATFAPSFYGDGGLGARHDVAASIILVAARSILEVLRPSASTPSAPSGELKSMALCYTPRVGEGKALPHNRDNRYRTMVMTMPLRASLVTDFEPNQDCLSDGPCVCDPNLPIVWRAKDPLPAEGGPAPMYEKIGALSLESGHVQSHEIQGTRVAGTYFFESTADVYGPKELDREKTYARYSKGLRSAVIEAFGLRGEYADWDFHKSGSIELEGWWRAFRLGRTDFTLGLHGGATYLDAEHSAWRPLVGLNAGVGWSVLFLEAGIRREYIFSSPSDLDVAYTWTLGLRFAASTSWFRKLKPDDCP